MEQAIKQREENNRLELLQAKANIKLTAKVRERFDYADTAQWLAQDKNLEDLTIVSNAITEWILNPKITEAKKKELTELLQSVWRSMAYCQNLETVTKTAVSKYSFTEKQFSKYLSEIRLLKLEKTQKDKEIESLKKEIEFISK